VKAGIQEHSNEKRLKILDSCFRRNDDLETTCYYALPSNFHTCPRKIILDKYGCKLEPAGQNFLSHLFKELKKVGKHILNKSIEALAKVLKLKCSRKPESFRD